MKIAFVGKGGSGKTTMASLFAMQMANDGHSVLALDADINQHLAQSIGVDDELPSMGLRQGEIKQYLAGSNPRFSYKTMQKTTPPGRGSRLLNIESGDWFIRTFTRTSSEGVRVAGAGEIPEGNIGVKCYHGLNGAVELVLAHLIDKPSDVVVVDMTAGADVFSSSLFVKVDALVLIVEPTMKSIAVYDQIKGPAKKYGVPLMVVANKVVDQEDKNFILSHIDTVVAWIGPSVYVKKRERGNVVSISDVEPEVVESLRTLYGVIARLGRDWNSLQQRMNEMHIKNAESWMGEVAKEHIDPNFSLESVAKA
jgi:CO dehydrogenase maturation factor